MEEPAGRLHRARPLPTLLYAPRGAPRRGAQAGNPDDSRLGTAPAESSCHRAGQAALLHREQPFTLQPCPSHRRPRPGRADHRRAVPGVYAGLPDRHGPQLGAHVQHVRHAPRPL